MSPSDFKYEHTLHPHTYHRHNKVVKTNVNVAKSVTVTNTYYVEYEKRRRSPDILKLYAAYWSVRFHR